MSLGREQTEAAARAADQATDGPTQQISMAAVSDRCVNCGAPLASDQRYCVTCGERRGKPRFTVAVETDGADGVTTVTTTSGPPPKRTRTSATFNLIAGVATLLLALGVGVLIGHNSTNSGSGKAPATQVITVGGGSGAASTNAASNSDNSSASGGSGGGSSSKSHKGSSPKSTAAAATKAPPKVVVQQAAAAASKVTGGSAKVASPTVTQGAQCTAGSAGCENGHFTGNMFGN